MFYRYAHIPRRNRCSRTGPFTLVRCRSWHNIPVHSKWDFLLPASRARLSAHSYLQCMVSKYIIPWLFNDQRISVQNNHVPLGYNATRLIEPEHMVMSGIDVQKCIRTILRNGGTFSCDNRIGLGYLDRFATDLRLVFGSVFQ